MNKVLLEKNMNRRTYVRCGIEHPDLPHVKCVRGIQHEIMHEGKDEERGFEYKWPIGENEEIEHDQSLYQQLGVELADKLINEAERLVARPEYMRDKRKVAEHANMILREAYDVLFDEGYLYHIDDL